MTAYEYLDLANSGIANTTATLMIGFTMLSAYLVVAYVVGSKLKTFQVIALTGIYTISALFNTVAHWAGMREALELKRLAKELSPDLDIAYSAEAPYIALIIRLSIFVISLWFMWDIRHPKSE